MENGINQIPLNFAYIWDYVTIPDECEDYGPTILYINMPETMEERSKLFQQFGKDADDILCERCWDPNEHIRGW